MAWKFAHIPRGELPTEQELRAAVVALGIDMTEWEDARYPADEVMLDSVVAKALEMREAGCPAVS